MGVMVPPACPDSFPFRPAAWIIIGRAPTLYSNSGLAHPARFASSTPLSVQPSLCYSLPDSSGPVLLVSLLGSWSEGGSSSSFFCRVLMRFTPHSNDGSNGSHSEEAAGSSGEVVVYGCAARRVSLTCLSRGVRWRCASWYLSDRHPGPIR